VATILRPYAAGVKMRFTGRVPALKVPAHSEVALCRCLGQTEEEDVAGLGDEGQRAEIAHLALLDRRWKSNWSSLR
jgi:hypothetical protein